ncbi:MAG: hypothetical protein Q3996_01860 [Candidatus Saccharibacteria bacterium]|nr:hypothetical protein [Candidatus Saccharibacteria bacterium]
MAKKKTSHSSSRKVKLISKRNNSTSMKQSKTMRFTDKIKLLLVQIKEKITVGLKKIRVSWHDHRSRRPHHSFRHTPNKISYRPLKIEGYFKFSHLVLTQIWSERVFFLKLMSVLIIAGVLMIGVMPQTTYDAFKKALDTSYQNKTDEGVGGTVYKSSLLLISTITSGGFNSINSEVGRISIGFLSILAWLAITWYLRERIAKQASLRLRDVLYRCCAPIVSLVLVMLYILLQLVPMMIVLIFYSAALTTNFASEGFGAMLIHGVMFLTTVLTIYWIEGSFLALAIVTNRGYYPLQAIKIAGDMAIGRRFKILLRLIWHCAQVVGMWIVLGLPVVLLERWLGTKIVLLKNIPIVPAWVAILTIVSLIWTYTYVYLFYRKIVEDESEPA